ncbi:MAG: murein hydrolase activator EnvC family protein [Gemmatimonadales bacterium]
MSRTTILALLTAAYGFGAAPAHAQNDVVRQIRENESRLEAIRGERTRLESELNRLRGRAHNINTELVNISEQRNTTSRLVNEIDRQIRGLNAQLDTITLDLVLAQDALVEKRSVLDRRLSDIYKRGALWAFQVLLAAESFGDLINRYKYLYLVSRQDRALANEVEELRDRIADQRTQVVAVQSALTRNREDRGRELGRFQQLENQRRQRLRSLQASEAEATRQLENLEQTESETVRLIARLEEVRRTAVVRGTRASVGPMITDADLGRLPWPIQGEVVYGFGSVNMPNGARVQQNGIGIRAPAGTPVRAVAAGSVVLAEPYSTYGPSVWIDHGGVYTLYLYLSQVDVLSGQDVLEGDQVGLSGGQASEWGSHVEFQIRGSNGIALDPANWLSSRH